MKTLYCVYQYAFCCFDKQNYFTLLLFVCIFLVRFISQNSYFRFLSNCFTVYIIKNISCIRNIATSILKFVINVHAIRNYNFVLTGLYVNRLLIWNFWSKIRFYFITFVVVLCQVRSAFRKKKTLFKCLSLVT